MGKTNQETITTFAEVFSSSGISSHQNNRTANTNDNRLMIYFQGMKRKRKINQRIEKILQFLYTVIRTANILIYIVPEQSAMTFLFQGANSARAVSVILVLGRRSSR